jgi:phosphatidylglycerol:prolipoprotein diacylglycerol transferase
MMSPYVNIFGFSVQAYPLLVLVAVSVGLWLAAREARQLGLDGDHVYNMGFYALLATLLGARLVYVLSHWFAYRDALFSALSPTPTAFSWLEGAVIGSVVTIIYWMRYRLPVGVTLDAIAPGLALALSLERVGAFLDGMNFGEPTTLPWGITMWGEVRHPVQLYEAAALLVILAILWWRRPSGKTGATPFEGHSFVLFVALYAGSRLFLEAFRADTPLIAGGLRATQVVALAVLLGGVWYIYRRRFYDG